MRDCPGCGYPAKDHMTKCPMCGSSIPQTKGIPVYTKPSAPVIGGTPFSGPNGIGISALLGSLSLQASHLLFDNAAHPAGSLRVIGLKAGAPSEIVIPETYGGKAVTQIADNAFSGSGVVSIHIPRSVRSIGDEAFADCGALSSVTGCENLTFIGRRAFAGCIHLTVCELPAHPRADRSSFAGCFDGGMALEANVIFSEEED